jgi:hypothetical protein
VKSQKLKRILSSRNVKISLVTAAILVAAICAFSCDSDTKTEAPSELKDFEVDNFGELTTKYPLGWAYFVVDPEKKEIVSKGRTGLSNDFEIDWSEAGVHELTAERVIYQLPDISYKSEENRTGSQMINFPRGVGKSPRVDFSPEGLDMWVQMFVDREGRPVAVMGFKKKPSKEE